MCSLGWVVGGLCGYFVGGASVSAVAVGVFFDGFVEGAAVYVWPEYVHEDHFGVGALPEEEVGDALFSGGAEEEVYIG